MFGMGFFEILIIIIVAIIFLGPDKLPQALVDIARFFKTIKKISQDAKETFDKELHLQHLKQEVIDYKNHFTNEIDDITKDIQPKAIASDISSNINDVKMMFDEYKNLPDEINTNTPNNPSKTSDSLDSAKQYAPYNPTNIIESSKEIKPKKTKTTPKKTANSRAKTAKTFNRQAKTSKQQKA